VNHRAVTWNTKVGRRPAAVVDGIQQIHRETDALVFLLQEAHGYVETLRRLPDWNLAVANGRGEAQGTPILIHRDLHYRRHHAIRCRTRWVGPKAGRPHRGRVFTVATIEDVLWVNVHRTRPGWSKRGGAFAEEYQRLLDLARDTDGPLVMAGDQNIGTRLGGDRGKNTPWELAQTIRGRVVTTTPGRVDYAIVRGLEGTAQQLGEYGSDHGAVLLTLSERGARTS
jgi:endonuclease/exonuclease/phosphatase (EEP) superfamily protein YafD